MKILLACLLLAGTGFFPFGCEGCGCASFSGVQVTNPNTDITLMLTVSTAYNPYDEDAPVRKLPPGGQWFVPAPLFLDHQNLVITVKAYSKGEFLALRTRSFSFSGYYTRIEYWDVKRSELGIR